MTLYPAFLDLAGREVVLVGSGTVVVMLRPIGEPNAALEMTS